MTFVDARQDAALQSGHFNDFIRIGKIRSAIWNAVKEADEPIGSDRIARLVFKHLHLSHNDYFRFPNCIIRKSKFPQNPKRSVRFSGKRTKRSVQKRKARNTQKAETKVL